MGTMLQWDRTLAYELVNTAAHDPHRVLHMGTYMGSAAMLCSTYMAYAAVAIPASPRMRMVSMVDIMVNC